MNLIKDKIADGQWITPSDLSGDQLRNHIRTASQGYYLGSDCKVCKCVSLSAAQVVELANGKHCTLYFEEQSDLTHLFRNQPTTVSLTETSFVVNEISFPIDSIAQTPDGQPIFVAKYWLTLFEGEYMTVFDVWFKVDGVVYHLGIADSDLRPVPSHPNLLCDRWAQVFNAQSRNKSIFPLAQDIRGGSRKYLYVSYGNYKDLRVNRLVCEAWHGTPKYMDEASHLNNDSMDNRPDNLAWHDHETNMVHGRIFRQLQERVPGAAESKLVNVALETAEKVVAAKHALSAEKYAAAYAELLADAILKLKQQ